MKQLVKSGLLGLALAVSTACADEGMWLYNNTPKQYLKEKYNFDASDAWLDHLRLSSVRFNSGGSGSFVSGNGLVMTNHHVGADTLAKISTKEKNYLQNSFYAKTLADEVKATDLELNVLLSIKDVTAEVNSAVTEGMPAGEAFAARRKKMSEIEKTALQGKDQKKFRADIVTLFNGGAYHLYQFKKYTDVRLVFAPEKDIAFFGGDPDNFEYPRFDLDVCFFRAYEDGKPAKPEHFLKWSEAGCKEGDLTFVSGHPGRTSRGFTVKHLEMLRDFTMPNQLNLLRRMEITLKNYADRSLENERQAEDELFGIQNSRKARLGGLAGLQDPAVMYKKSNDEKALRAAMANDAKLQPLESAFADVEKTLTVARELSTQYNLLERGIAFNSEYFGIARTLVRAADELAKPDGDRLREFRESGIESLKEGLFAENPIYKDLEIAKLTSSLGLMLEQFGGSAEFCTVVMNNKSPAARALELVSGTKIGSVDVRKRLFEGGKDAISKSDDPMIQLAKMVDDSSRAVRKRFETEVDEPQRQAYAKIAQARFAVQGQNVYPDATFTLRLAFGEVKGYEENGQKVPALTTMGGAFEHSKKHGEVKPFKLPKTWIEKKDKIKLDTPFNFVSTADIIGGNSGSPVVNRAGEVVGLIFDGNIQSLVLDFAFTDTQGRAVSVHSAGIVEALRSVYEANELAKELTGK